MIDGVSADTIDNSQASDTIAHAHRISFRYGLPIGSSGAWTVGADRAPRRGDRRIGAESAGTEHARGQSGTALGIG